MWYHLRYISFGWWRASVVGPFYGVYEIWEVSSFVKIWHELRALYRQTELCTFMTISRLILTGMRNFLDKGVEKIKHILTAISSTITHPKILLLWNNVKKFCRSRQVIRRMRFARWTTKATETHSEHEILVVFPQQHLLSECASVLYKGWIQSSGNTAVTWRMCVGWHYCRLYLIAEVQLK